MVKVKFPVVIVAVISIAGSSTIQVSAEVRRFQSPLVATGRRYACPSEEPLSFKCEVNGRYLCWTFNLVYQTTFFYDYPVNHAETVADSYRVWAILTVNQALSGNNLDTTFRRLSSTLTLDSSQSLMENQGPHNISCSSDTTEQAMVTLITVAETPNKPQNVTASQVSQRQSTDQQAPNSPSNDTMLIQWKAPSNIDQFDFERYSISIFITELETGLKYYLNRTSIEPEYQIHIPHRSIANVSISAVSECPQLVGLKSDPVVILNNGVSIPSRSEVVSQVEAKTVTASNDLYASNGVKDTKAGNIGLVSAILFGMYCITS